MLPSLILINTIYKSPECFLIANDRDFSVTVIKKKHIHKLNGMILKTLKME